MNLSSGAPEKSTDADHDWTIWFDSTNTLEHRMFRRRYCCKAYRSTLTAILAASALM